MTQKTNQTKARVIPVIQTSIFKGDLLTLREASQWASDYLKRAVSVSNISYLVQYGRVRKYGNNGNLMVSKKDLLKYYNSFNGKREIEWKSKLGDDLNWHLSFDTYSEAERTKHVHRLHPYKGKFIPQLVEYFLDGHVDQFKRRQYFRPGDIVLDPFCGSGTTLVQANELGIHAIGVDISEFNSLISNVKIRKHDFAELYFQIDRITKALRKYITDSNTIAFEKALLEDLNQFNNKHFPSPDYKRWLYNGEIQEKPYTRDKLKLILPRFEARVREFGIDLSYSANGSFMSKWFFKHVRAEIEFVKDKIEQVESKDIREVLQIILSRTMRSCRATTHSDLATLKEPVTSVYYCTKHGKICKPLFSIFGWWERYSQDTLTRLEEFRNQRTETYQICLTADSRSVDIVKVLKNTDKKFATLFRQKKISGIFSSPPYVGLIDYHDQHAYAYDLFGFDRRDSQEIGPLSKGQGKEARDSYVESIAHVLINCKRFMAKDFNILLVANDKFNIYPIIAEKAGMQIVEEYKRPVLNRTERDKGAYSESIFCFKSRH